MTSSIRSPSLSAFLIWVFPDNGFGYIYSGIQAPLIDDLVGMLILVVATNDLRTSIGLSNELAQLQTDFDLAHGWYVVGEDVSSK